MPQAQVRSPLPQAFPLTAAEVNALGSTGIHVVTLREEEQFAPRVELRPLPHRERISVGAVAVSVHDAGVHLRYRYSKSSGAPASPITGASLAIALSGFTG